MSDESGRRDDADSDSGRDGDGHRDGDADSDGRHDTGTDADGDGSHDTDTDADSDASRNDAGTDADSDASRHDSDDSRNDADSRSDDSRNDADSRSDDSRNDADSRSDASRNDADSRSGDGRHGRVTSHPTPGPGNSLSAWWRTIRNPMRVAVNYAVIWLVRVSPSLWLKRWLLRRLGATVGPGVAFGLEATPDVFFPDLITVERDAVVGYDATVLCHEFLQDEYRTGEVVIRERAMVGAGAILLPGVEVGADAQVAANSLVTRDVPPGATVAGVPATEMGSDAVESEEVKSDAVESEEVKSDAVESDEDAATGPPRYTDSR